MGSVFGVEVKVRVSLVKRVRAEAKLQANDCPS